MTLAQTVDELDSPRRRWLPRILAAVLLVATFAFIAPAPAQAAPVFTTVGGITFMADDYDISAGAVVVNYDHTGPMGSAPVIPANVEIDGIVYIVTEIGENAFAGKGLTSVELPPTVTVIGEQAFRWNYLTNVVVPDCVVEIWYRAFADNPLTNLTLGGQVALIADEAFLNNNLTQVSIPPLVQHIGMYVFVNWSRPGDLTSVHFQGDAPDIFMPATLSGASLGPSQGKLITFRSTSLGFSTPTWEGYNSAVVFTPGSPPDLTATPGDAQVTLTWSQPYNDGGAPVTDYVIQSSTDGVTWVPFVDQVSTERSATVTGLTNGTAYAFRVAAVNVAGRGFWGFLDPVTPAVPLFAPDAPTALTAIAGDAQVALTWSAPAVDGGSAITDYTIEYSTDGFVWLPLTHPASTLANATVTGLTNDTQYVFRVAAVNAVGTGLRSDVASATPAAPIVPPVNPDPPTPPSPPTPPGPGDPQVTTPSNRLAATGSSSAMPMVALGALLVAAGALLVGRRVTR